MWRTVAGHLDGCNLVCSYGNLVEIEFKYHAKSKFNAHFSNFGLSACLCVAPGQLKLLEVYYKYIGSVWDLDENKKHIELGVKRVGPWRNQKTNLNNWRAQLIKFPMQDGDCLIRNNFECISLLICNLTSVIKAGVRWRKTSLVIATNQF